MRNRLRRPLTWVWVVAFAFACLLGFVIGGNPVVARDVPLRDRQVVPTTVTTTVPAGPTTSATEAGG